MNLATHIEEFFHDFGPGQTTGVVAVSGGPDSVALAHLLVGLFARGKFVRLILAHVNHQLRGAESDADEEFVRRLPSLWQWEPDARLLCRTQRIAVAEIAAAERENLESIARRERYQWCVQLAQEEGAAWIATGHTADDQAETVLFRLLRGSGVLGLGAMPQERALGEHVTLLRPLLTVRRQTLLDYLQLHAIPYRIDSSNLDTRFSRNRLRLELLPLLQRDYNPGIVDVLCRLAEQSQDVHLAISGQAAALLARAELPRAGEMSVFAVDPLREVAVNLVREMFRLVWQREGWPTGEMDFVRWNRLVEIVQGTHSAWDFPGRIRVRRVNQIMQISKV